MNAGGVDKACKSNGLCVKHKETSKHETLNPKQIQNPKFEIQKYV